MSEEKNKPVLDEQTLAKLLEAAYVLQEHNREVRELELGLDLKRDQIEAAEKAKSTTSPETLKTQPPQPAGQGDYTFTLAQIVATQHQIQIRHLELENAMSLVAERVVDIARASGAAIGILDGTKIRYRAVAGSQTLKVGTEVPMEKALCLPCIRNAQVFRCPDVNPEFLVDTEECRRRGIQSLIAVPIFHEGGVAGGLELYYSNQNGFTEQDVHSCQLMAGLVTEALARDVEQDWKQSIASERAAMLEALEKLKPSLAALIDGGPAKDAAAKAIPVFPSGPTYTCAKCGHGLFAEEHFCGQCGSPRLGPEPAGKENSAQPLLQIHDTSVDATKTSPAPAKVHDSPGMLESEESLANSLEEEFPELFAAYEGPFEKAHDSKKPLEKPSATAGPSTAEEPRDLKRHLEIAAHAVEDEGSPEEASSKDEAEEEVALAQAAPSADWSSAASARDYLEQLAAGQQRGALARFWDARRGDIYLAIAVVLVACVIRWGIWSNHPVSATAAPNTAAAGHQKIDPLADLSPFERMLISLGLAETPEVPEDKGNPSAQVWVDLQTALYYCPGSDLYGKTQKGKYATQRDAQLDQYQPAYRKACN